MVFGLVVAPLLRAWAAEPGQRGGRTWTGGCRADLLGQTPTQGPRGEVGCQARGVGALGESVGPLFLQVKAALLFLDHLLRGSDQSLDLTGLRAAAVGLSWIVVPQVAGRASVWGADHTVLVPVGTAYTQTNREKQSYLSMHMASATWGSMKTQEEAGIEKGWMDLCILAVCHHSFR